MDVSISITSSPHEVQHLGAHQGVVEGYISNYIYLSVYASIDRRIYIDRFFSDEIQHLRTH